MFISQLKYLCPKIFSVRVLPLYWYFDISSFTKLFDVMNIMRISSKIAFEVFADFLVWRVSKVHWYPQSQLSVDGGTSGLKGGDEKHLKPGLHQFAWLRCSNIIWQAKNDNKVQFKLNYLYILQCDCNVQQTRISWEEIRGRDEINIVSHIPQFHLMVTIYKETS